QAEDGIRDRNVTGVQTCALPICARGFSGGIASLFTLPSALSRRDTSTSLSHASASSARIVFLRSRSARSVSALTSGASMVWATRSEERRVGKGGGERRGPERHR